VSQQVLHLDFISLNPQVGPDDRRLLQDAAAELTQLEQVIGAGVVEADAGAEFDIVFYFLLPDFSALEPFGTDPRYSRFLQGSVAPRLRGFSGADVRLDNDFRADGAFAACLALTAPDETYDWEVRQALEDWSRDCHAPGSVIGLAVGERQRYRGAGLVFASQPIVTKLPSDNRFGSTLVTGAARPLT
jgi:hypothetical protein